jgi:hypothetical protein
MADITLGRRAPWLTDIELTTVAKEIAIPTGVFSLACVEDFNHLEISYDGTTYAAVDSSAGFIVWSDRKGGGGTVYLKLSSGSPATHPFLSRNHL